MAQNSSTDSEVPTDEIWIPPAKKIIVHPQVPPRRQKEKEITYSQPVQSVPWGRHVERLSGTLKALAAAKDLQSTLRDDQKLCSFIKVLSTSSSHGDLMPFPTDFARDYMPLGRSAVTLVDENERTWPAEWAWKPGQMHPGLRAGWKPFAAHHPLTRGDVVLIELVHPATLRFKVHVFKRKRFVTVSWLPDGGKETRLGMVPRPSEAQIRVDVECAHKLRSAEKVGLKLVLQAAKVENIQRVLHANSSIRASQSGSFSAGIGKKELVKILKLAFPLDDAVNGDV